MRSTNFVKAPDLAPAQI